LKRDDLLLDEIFIWDNLIKWCLAQHSNISQDSTQWNNEEITIMERTIHKFISSIRFYHISSENFAIKIYPFKEIIPKELVSNMVLFHMAQNKQLNEDKRPPRQSKCNIDSVIINLNHVAIFANWIHRKEKIPEYIPYNFNLLYRASRDGNTAATFHEKCDNKGATIVVVKITNSEQIVGGYNPLSWDTSLGWKSTYDSFIFSFTNENDLKNTKVSYSNGNKKSIYNYKNCGPAFGGGCDFYFDKGIWYSNVSGWCSYLKIDIPGNFKADDYEVFQVVKK
jgi:hypothetical protein